MCTSLYINVLPENVARGFACIIISYFQVIAISFPTANCCPECGCFLCSFHVHLFFPGHIPSVGVILKRKNKRNTYRTRQSCSDVYLFFAQVTPYPLRRHVHMHAMRRKVLKTKKKNLKNYNPSA